MILCPKPNAAMDQTVAVPSFEIKKIHQPQSMIALAGGIEAQPALEEAMKYVA